MLDIPSVARESLDAARSFPGEVNFFQAKRRNLADVRSRWSPQIGYICNVASALISWLKLSTLDRSPRR
jgi:hypothetical protein